MKIAFVSNLLEPTGGDNILLHHIEGLNDLGHSVDGYFTGIMKESTEKYGNLKYVKTFNRNNIKGLNLHKYDLIVGNGLFGAQVLFDKQIPYVQFLQNFDPWIFGKSKEIDNIYNAFDQILLYSSHLENIVRHYYGEKKFTKCNNGIEYKTFQKYKTQQKNKSVCFCVAYYRPYKGIKLTNKVFGILKEKGFRTVEICAVNGPLPNTMEFYRNPSIERKCEIISECGITLHPSVFETWNLVSMESMALGTPVVGTNSKGIMEYANKENSIILNNRNPELIANTIIQLWDNKEKYNNLVNQGIKTAKSHNWATIMPSIEKKYLTIIENENRK